MIMSVERNTNQNTTAEPIVLYPSESISFNYENQILFSRI